MDGVRLRLTDKSDHEQDDKNKYKGTSSIIVIIETCQIYVLASDNKLLVATARTC